LRVRAHDTKGRGVAGGGSWTGKGVHYHPPTPHPGPRSWCADDNTGIKYNVMPPGKRYRELEQLSGGEKTVAAVALLFALHAHRPAPFLIMDEVDAALDNHNVQRVAAYVRRRTRPGATSLQAIVVTHKDLFYERASGVVGVYRDAATGGSKTLTLDLEAFPDERGGAAAEAAATAAAVGGRSGVASPPSAGGWGVASGGSGLAGAGGAGVGVAVGRR
jgi:hypothetical protein